MAAPSDADSQYSNPITGLDRPVEFQEVEAPSFLQRRHSAIHTGHLYPRKYS